MENKTMNEQTPREDAAGAGKAAAPRPPQHILETPPAAVVEGYVASRRDGVTRDGTPSARLVVRVFYATPSRRKSETWLPVWFYGEPRPACNAGDLVRIPVRVLGRVRPDGTVHAWLRGSSAEVLWTPGGGAAYDPTVPGERDLEN